MRWLGALLGLAGAGGGYLLARRESLLPERLARALLVDLGVLADGVCCLRRPLPDILGKDLAEGLGAVWLWRPLLEMLKGETGQSLPACWAEVTGQLPAPMDGMLASLGPLLPAGGEALRRAIEETREELTGFLREERSRQAVEARLTAAVCLSGACLLILVLM